MKKLMMLAAVLLLSCKSGSPTAKGEAHSYVLDAGKSRLSAIAMKNETKAVELRFPSLDGSLELSPLKATVNAAIDKLETGDKTRDSNVKTLFFEVAKSAAFGKAQFVLSRLEGDLAGLKVGDSFPMKGSGTLGLHGASVNLSGPLNVTRLKNGYSANFSSLWTVNIKDAGMSEMLDNLNKNCPQPHRVGLNVALQGELIFVKR